MIVGIHQASAVVVARIARTLARLALAARPAHGADASAVGTARASVETAQSAAIGFPIGTLVQRFTLDSVFDHVQPSPINLFFVW